MNLLIKLQKSHKKLQQNTSETFETETKLPKGKLLTIEHKYKYILVEYQKIENSYNNSTI